MDEAKKMSIPVAVEVELVDAPAWPIIGTSGVNIRLGSIHIASVVIRTRALSDVYAEAQTDDGAPFPLESLPSDVRVVVEQFAERAKLRLLEQRAREFSGAASAQREKVFGKKAVE